MPTFRDIYTWRTSVRRRILSMNREGKSQAWKIARYMELQAKLNAPKDTGRLTKSVRKTKRKNGYTVSAGYTERGFNVGLWANRDIVGKWTTDGISNKQPFFAFGTTGRYGDSFKSPSGNAVEWTARKPNNIGFWTQALTSTYRKYGKGKVIQALRTKLRE